MQGRVWPGKYASLCYHILVKVTVQFIHELWSCHVEKSIQERDHQTFEITTYKKNNLSLNIELRILLYESRVNIKHIWNITVLANSVKRYLN